MRWMILLIILFLAVPVKAANPYHPSHPRHGYGTWVDTNTYTLKLDFEAYTNSWVWIDASTNYANVVASNVGYAINHAAYPTQTAAPRNRYGRLENSFRNWYNVSVFAQMGTNKQYSIWDESIVADAPCTWTFWTRLDRTNDIDYVMTKWALTTAAKREWIVGTHYGRPAMWVYAVGGGAFSNKIAVGGLAAGEWYHLAFTYETNTMLMYTNGILVTSFTYPYVGAIGHTTNTAGHFTVGALVDDNGTTPHVKGFSAGYYDHVTFTKGVAFSSNAIYTLAQNTAPWDNLTTRVTDLASNVPNTYILGRTGSTALWNGQRSSLYNGKRVNQGWFTNLVAWYDFSWKTNTNPTNIWDYSNGGNNGSFTCDWRNESKISGRRYVSFNRILYCSVFG